MKLLQTLELIDRTDQLIRLKATGTPTELAIKLTLSERTVRRLINTMKEMGAPIKYCIHRQSYYYEDSVYFRFGFYCKQGAIERLYGGVRKFSEIFTLLKRKRSNNDRLSTYHCENNIVNRNSIS